MNVFVIIIIIIREENVSHISQHIFFDDYPLKLDICQIDSQPRENISQIISELLMTGGL